MSQQEQQQQQPTGPADESDVISALSALANQAELHQGGPSGGQPSQPHEDDLFAPDAPLPSSPSQQLLHLPVGDYSSLTFKDLRGGSGQKAAGRDAPFDADAVLERYYQSGGATEEGDMAAVAGPQAGAASLAGGPLETSRHRQLKLTLQPFAAEWIKANYEPNATFSIPRDAMFKSYLAACETQNIVPVNSASFGKSVNAAFADGVVKMRRLGGRGQSRYNYSGLRPSNDAEEENVRKFSDVGDIVGNGSQPVKSGRRSSKGAPVEEDGAAGGSSTGARSTRDKGKKRAPPDAPQANDPGSASKKVRQDPPPVDWSSSSQEGRYIVALNQAFDSIREAVPALRAQPESGFVDGVQTPRVSGRVTTLTLARDYILHLQQERLSFLRERERHERETRALEDFVRDGGTADGLTDWRRSWEDAERSQAQADPSVSLEDPFGAHQPDGQQQQQQHQQHQLHQQAHDPAHDDQETMAASLEAFARGENLFHSPSLEDQLQSLHQQQQREDQGHAHGAGDDGSHPADGSDYGFLGQAAYGGGLGHDASGTGAGPSSSSGRLVTPGDSLAFMSAIASEPAYNFDPTTGSIAEDAEDRRRERIQRETKERNKAKQARYRLKQKTKVKALEAENRKFKGASNEPSDDGGGIGGQHLQQQDHALQQHDPHGVGNGHVGVGVGIGSSDLAHLILHDDPDDGQHVHVHGHGHGHHGGGGVNDDDDGMTREEARLLESIGSVDPSLMEGLDEHGNLAALDLTQYHA